MVKKFLKYLGYIILGIVAFAILLLIFFNLPGPKPKENIELGVTFSKRYAEDISLNWKEAYIAALDDLKVRKIRIPVYWDLVEKQDGTYDYSDIDWQLDEAKKRNAEVILVVGQKVPRWPECAIPEKYKNDDKARKAALLKHINRAVSHFKSNEAIKYWQVENEPFLKFGICPELDVNLLDAEISLVRQIDPGRNIILTDSGELSLWVEAAKRADIFGTTMYRTIWKEKFGYVTYPIGPRFFIFKSWLNRLFADQKNNIVIELQAEPWIKGWTTNAPTEEQFKSMNPEKLEENVEYAKRVGFPEVYLWGVEWWYWVKVHRGHPEVWEMAQKIFQNQ